MLQIGERRENHGIKGCAIERALRESPQSSARFSSVIRHGLRSDTGRDVLLLGTHARRRATPRAQQPQANDKERSVGGPRAVD